MQKVGRNDPCPCGSGKKFKKCCEERLTKRKFSASVIRSGKVEIGSEDKAKQVSNHFFEKIVVPKPQAPEHQPPHDHPENDLPM